MIKLISNSTTISKSIKWKSLSENTTRIPFTNVESIVWKDIRELHILGSQQTDHDQKSFWNDDISIKHAGCYISYDRKWILLLCPPENQITKLVSLCTEQLINLDIRFTSISQIELSHLNRVKRLNLSDNKQLVTILGLDNLKDLSVLNLSRSPFSFDLNVSSFNSLYSLSIRETGINKVIAHYPLLSMAFFDAANSMLQDGTVISQFPSLKILNVLIDLTQHTTRCSDRSG